MGYSRFGNALDYRWCTGLRSSQKQNLKVITWHDEDIERLDVPLLLDSSGHEGAEALLRVMVVRL